jgi:hypothetical protein
MLKDIFRVEDCPSSLGEFSSVWLQGKGPMPDRPLIFFFAGFAWAIWTMRNKMAIEKSFAKAPTNVIYHAVSLLQRWCVLLKEKDKRPRQSGSGGDSNTSMATDVFEI